MGSLFRLVRRALAAVLLAAMLLCAAEVGLRLARWQSSRSSTLTVEDLAQPSSATFYELPRATSLAAPAGFEIRTNCFGLRGREPQIPKPPDRLRILCLGDETTLALHLEDAATYAARLEERLRNTARMDVEVLNCGLPRGCPLTLAALFRQSLHGLAPDLVLIHVSANDILDDAQIRLHGRVDSNGIPLAVVHPRFEANPGRLQPLEHEFAVIGCLRGRIASELVGVSRQSPREQWEQSRLRWENLRTGQSAPDVLQPLDALRLLTDACSAELVVCTCPDGWQSAAMVRESLNDNPPPGSVGDALALWCGHSGIQFVDATGAFLGSESPQSLYVSGSAELSAEGHRLYAEVLFESLTRRQ